MMQNLLPRDTPLALDLQGICKKYGVVEFVFAGWDDKDTITVLHNAREKGTIPMEEVYEYALAKAIKVQEECKNRQQ